MFQKSFLILGTCAIVAFAGILLWAWFQDSGPSDAIARARTQLAAGQLGPAIGELDRVERELIGTGRREPLAEVWRLRYQAHAAIHNTKGALLDLQRLLQSKPADAEQLQLEQVRLLAIDGQGQSARLAARQFLQQHPDHSRGRELAGEACQTIYQPMLRAVRETIEREISRLDHDAARRALLAYVYRPDGDPEIDRSLEFLSAMFRTDPRRIALLPTLQRDLDLVRREVQEGLGYFERSLDGGDEPVAAFRAVATALGRSGRVDDLLIACEIQRRRFDHAYVEESGQRAAWARVEAGLPRAAIATVDRWLPRDRIDALIEADQFGSVSEDLILARTVAAWHLRDQQALDESHELIDHIRNRLKERLGHGNVLLTPLHVSLATRRILRGNREPDRIQQSLEQVCERLLRVPPTVGRPDLGAEFTEVLVGFLEEQAAPHAQVQQALQRWREQRPGTVEPLVHIAAFLSETGKTSAAFATLDEAAELDPLHPGLFDVRLKAAEKHFEGSSQDGPGLLASCAKRNAIEPEVTDPIGYVLCAQTALALQDGRAQRVAAACAQRAVDAFPTANLPRQLLLRALLRLGRVDDADRAADAALLALVPDPETFRLAVEAKTAAGRSMRALVRAAMPVVRDSTTLSPELVRLALEDAPATAAVFVTAAMRSPSAPLAARLLAARALAAGGDVKASEALLASAAPGETPELREACALAFTAWLRARADDTDDDALLAAAEATHARLALAAGPQAPLFAVAAALAAARPRTAYAMLRLALVAADAEERSGEQLALAGDLALRLGLLAQAEEHYTAAIAFADGGRVAEDLTRMMLAYGRSERAARVYQLVREHTDAALAARFGRLDLASPLAAAALQADPADLLTQATLATFGQSPLIDWQLASGQLQVDRLELLACMRNPHISALVSGRAQALVTTDPTSVTNHLLLARTLVDAGQPQLAALLHGQAYAGGHATPVLWREVAYAGTTQPGYDPGPVLFDRVTVAATGGQTAGSQLTLRWGIAQFVGAFEKAGLHEQADAVKVLQWMAAPNALPCTPAALELITANHLPVNACLILDRVLQGGNTDDRRMVLDRFYRIAEEVAAKEPIHKPGLAQLAGGHLARDGALGPVVHFLIDHGKDKSIDRTGLLRAHLEAIATGRDDARYLLRTMDQLQRRKGLAAAATLVDELLDRYPTAMPLWGERAKLQARLHDARTALDELRTVLDHAPDPFSTLTFVSLAAFERSLAPADIAALQQVPAALRATPDGVFAEALVAMREGRPDDALQLLADSPPQYDGRHLFATAFAALQSPAEDSLARARAAFEALQRDYASSSFARNVGKFVRQLSPRAASAEDSDTKR